MKAPKTVIKTAVEVFKHFPQAQSVIVASVQTGKQYEFDRSKPVR